MRQLFWISLCALVMLTGVSPALGDAATNGPDGINVPMGLTGAGIGIGQVEQRRPGLPGFDAAGNVHTSVVPAAVFRMNGSAVFADAADSTDPHAEEVAGIMISTDTTLRGVAPSASLYASAYVTMGTNPGYQDALVTMQHVAMQPNVWAINNSWGKPNSGMVLDGNSLLALGADWIASQFNVLQVIAGNEGTGGIPVPTDSFNGMVVAMSERVSGVGKWTQVSSVNYFGEVSNDGRSLISLIAPGDRYPKTDPGSVSTTAPHPRGTSYAAPQVTGAAALLQQRAELNINSTVPRWFPEARNHQVIKAVLMNSADKLIDDGTVMVNGNAVPQGGLLGMTRTVIDQNGANWLTSEAYGDGLQDGGGAISLDDQMGAGHLNVTRALQQYTPGEYEPDSDDVPAIGWDFGHTTGANNRNVYPIDGILAADHFISITLAWDRHVEFSNDVNTNNRYDSGDTFQASMSSLPTPDSDDLINNLDLFLLPKGSATVSNAVAQSISAEGTLQHIFFQIPVTGEYEIWVRQFDADVSGGEDYGLAWWASPPTLIFVPGDYNGDQVVDAQDYNVWRGDFGDTVTAGTGADGNGNGVIDGGDYVVWRNSLSGAGSGSSQAPVPEPSSALLLVLVSILLGATNRSRLS